jgi:hypothetical protein
MGGTDSVISSFLAFSSISFSYSCLALPSSVSFLWIYCRTAANFYFLAVTISSPILRSIDST